MPELLATQPQIEPLRPHPRHHGCEKYTTILCRPLVQLSESMASAGAVEKPQRASGRVGFAD